MLLADKTLNEKLETLQLDPTQFYHLPGFYRLTWFLNNYPWYFKTKNISGIIKFFNYVQTIKWFIIVNFLKILNLLH